MSPLRRDIRSAAPYRVPLGPARLCLDDVQVIAENLSDFLVKEDFNANTSRSRISVRRLLDWARGVSLIERSATTTQGTRAGLIENKLRSDLVVIVAGEAEADSVNDLREATRDEIEHVSVLSRSPRVRIDLWKQYAEVTTDQNDFTARAFADDVARFVRNKQRGLYLDVRSTSSIAVSFGALMVLDIIFHLGILTALVVISVIIIGLGVISDNIQARRRGAVTISLSWRSENRRLSRIGRHDIVVAIIGALTGAVVLGLAGLWAGFLNKH